MTLSPVVFYALIVIAGIAVAIAVYLYFLFRKQRAILELVGLFRQRGENDSDHNFPAELLAFLQAATGADTVSLLLEADAVTAEVTATFPTNPFPSSYLTPEIYAEATEQQQSIFISNYATYKHTSYILSSIPTDAAVFVPFQYAENRSGAILFLWKKTRKFNRVFRGYIEQVRCHVEAYIRVHDLVTRFSALEARYAAVLATMSQGIVLIDEQSVSAWVNDTAGQLLSLPPGYTEPHRIASAMNRLTQGAVNPDALRETLSSIYRNSKSIIDHIEWASAQPGGRVLRVSSRPVTKSGRVWMFDDITQLKQTEAKLRLAHEEILETVSTLEQVNRQLLHVNREKDDFLGIAAHDLKNPLSGILGISQIIAEDIELLLTEDIREYAQLIVGRTNTMFRLITDLLNINALESGSLPLHPESFPVDDVLRDVVRSNTVAATSKHITLVYSSVPSSLVYADRHATYQVLDNLLSNAVKYTPVGKTVTISVSEVEGAVECAIKDEGPGFSEEDHRKMFGRFTRLSALPTGGETSNGLGLYIVRKLTESMHGRVWCESRSGEGATFFVAFPSSPPDGMRNM